MSVMFGKKGRPPEDRLLRQREIYGAVAPLIVQDGVRQLSMRQAASVACLSIGGLYHYFPTKRDLVLHGLSPEAVYRHCQDFHEQFGYLADLDPERYIREGFAFLDTLVSFCRPAIHAALELGTESFWEVINTVLTATVLDFEATLRRVVPEISDEDLHLCGRAVRRSLCAALLDKSVAPNELHDELRVLMDGYVSRSSQREQALSGARGTATGV
jgi:AcrR family transcriptional regulator